MLKEELVNSSERFLQAFSICSDAVVNAWKGETLKRCWNKEKDTAYKTFINWRRRKNEVAILITYAYADFSIPKQFDCIFNYAEPYKYIQTAFILKQSIWNGWYPINCIEHGHNHICIFEFENGPPPIINNLYIEKQKYSTWRWDEKKVLGFCQSTDIKNIIERRQKMNDLRKLYGNDWMEFDR